MAEVAAWQLEAIRHERSGATTIEVIGAGDINDAVRVDDEVFRFPKNAHGRQNLRYESVILNKLAGQQISLRISEVRELADDAAYAIFSYVPGRVLTHDELANLNDASKRSAARKIAHFMIELNEALSLEEMTRLRHDLLPFWEKEDAYYEARLQQGIDTSYHRQYERYYHAYRQQVREQTPPEFVLYGDFHAGNMIFHEDELTGLIDFGDTGPGTIYNELRQLYMLGEGMVLTVAAELGGRFGAIDMEAVRLYAIMNEFSVLLRPESQPPHPSPRAAIAHRLLTKWLGEQWKDA